MPGWPGIAASSATPVAARGRARRRPGSGRSSPPPPGTQAKQLALNPAIPQRGFSRASCSIRAHLGGTGGRPGVSG